MNILITNFKGLFTLGCVGLSFSMLLEECHEVIALDINVHKAILNIPLSIVNDEISEFLTCSA